MPWSKNSTEPLLSSLVLQTSQCDLDVILLHFKIISI